MRCIDTVFGTLRLRTTSAGAVAVLLVACSSPLTPPRAPAPPAAPAPGAPAAPGANLPPTSTRPARNWDEYRIDAARRLLAANPTGVYMGVPPEPLLAIPVLEVELRADGGVQSIRVMRQPSQALDTTQLAIDAVRRAAPFGPVGHLPKPWRYTEVFLFDDQRRFKPRTLD